LCTTSILPSRDPSKSFPLYDAVLTAFGYQLERKSERGFGWELDAPTGSHSIELVRASEDGANRGHDRCSPGLHHLAWKVESREQVDRMHQVLLRAGATILDAPTEYSQYNKGRGYYAVFFADADRLKLECVYTPPSNW